MTDISVQQVSKYFGLVRAVEELTFEVPAGRVTGFLGPNGAGKTTTLRMLLGLVAPTNGQPLIGGRRYQDLPCARRVVGAVLEATGFHPGRRGRDHLRILAQVVGVPKSGWTRCSSRSNSPQTVGAGWAATRWACGSGSVWPGRCWVIRRC